MEKLRLKKNQSRFSKYNSYTFYIYLFFQKNLTILSNEKEAVELRLERQQQTTRVRFYQKFTFFSFFICIARIVDFSNLLLEVGNQKMRRKIYIIKICYDVDLSFLVYFSIVPSLDIPDNFVLLVYFPLSHPWISLIILYYQFIFQCPILGYP